MKGSKEFEISEIEDINKRITISPCGEGSDSIKIG